MGLCSLSEDHVDITDESGPCEAFVNGLDDMELFSIRVTTDRHWDDLSHGEHESAS